jgi:hypothetical protein
MSTSASNKRAYLVLNEELQTRIDLEYRKYRRGKRNYSLSKFLQRLITEALDQRDDVSGAKAALTNPVERRLISKMDNLAVMLLADFYLTAIRTIAPQEELDIAVLRNEALIWAASNHRLFDERVAELRNKIASSHAKTGDAES